MPDDVQRFNQITGKWESAIPEQYPHGLFAWLWLRLTGYRDRYGRKAKLYWGN